VPLNWTASGRLLVGHLDQTARVGFFRDSAQPSPTGRAVTDPDTLARAAGEAFARRISVQIGESDFSVACIAAPIRDPAGACAATISVVLPEFRAQKEPERYAAAVKATAGRIEHRLGWSHAD
jgi:DNA-binding IclR family transcriptional regulator